MTITPLLLLVNDKLIRPRFGTKEKEDDVADEMDEHNAVIIVGFADFGSTLGRLLRAHGVQATILDNDSDRVDFLRKLGFKVFYGDATRADLLASAGAEEAKLLISAIDSPETNLTLVETVRKHYPHLKLMIRARNRYGAYQLMDLAVEHIYRDSFDTAVRMGVDVLQEMGFRAYTAQRAGLLFSQQDEASLHKLVSERGDEKQYILRARQEIAWQEQLLQAERAVDLGANDHAWDSEPMREGIRDS
jgi:monovalent cation:H+ antiporter-2, CPA2 family